MVTVTITQRFISYLEGKVLYPSHSENEDWELKTNLCRRDTQPLAFKVFLTEPKYVRDPPIYQFTVWQVNKFLSAEYRLQSVIQIKDTQIAVQTRFFNTSPLNHLPFLGCRLNWHCCCYWWSKYKYVVD